MLIKNEIKAPVYQVVSHRLVSEFLGKEPDAKELVRQFAAGEASFNEFQIAGPPAMQELMRLRAEPDQVFSLPAITIKLSREKNHLTQEPMIRLTVSDADLAELERWTLVLRAGALAPRALLFGSPDGGEVRH